MASIYDIATDDYRSQLAGELVKLGPRLAARIRLHPAVVVAIEFVVCIAEAYVSGDGASLGGSGRRLAKEDERGADLLGSVWCRGRRI